MSYQFCDSNSIEEQNIIFLCGTAYKDKNVNDKRVILKNYLVNNFPENKNLILEEHFAFANVRNKLNYYDIYMRNLNDIEMLTAAFASKIIIIHESISTGAELAAFASKKFMHEKICILVPDSTAIEENKLSSFLRLAYFREETNITNITFYPETYVFQISKQHTEIRTNFKKNQITAVMGKKISEFISKDDADKIKKVKFSKCLFGKPSASFEDVSFCVNRKEGEVYVSSRVILFQLIAMFQFNDFRSEMRNDKSMIKHINFMENIYKKTMKNTISNLSGVHLDTISVYIKELDLKLRQVIAYSIYMIQALGYINIVTSGKIKKISISTNMDKEISKYEELVKNKQPYLVLE